MPSKIGRLTIYGGELTGMVRSILWIWNFSYFKLMCLPNCPIGKRKKTTKAVELIEPRLEKTNKVTVCPAKTEISLGIRPIWSESSLCAEWLAKDPSFLHADSEDSDRTGRMPRLIWVFAGRTVALGFVMLRLNFRWLVYEPCHVKTCLCHMQKTKLQIILCYLLSRQNDT